MNPATRISISGLLLAVFLLLLFPFPLSAASPLASHASPYIRMHASDAVNWRLWDPAVLQQAQRENKLIFFSIGYFACHWCHVMREQSFNHTAVAGLLNKRYIPVKIDRELNPALDAYLMDFVQMTRGHGGWPLNVFVTPEGYPLVGLVYLPQPDFLQLLQRLDGDWRDKNSQLRALAEKAFEFSKNVYSQSLPMPSADRLSDVLLAAVREQADELSGGFGHQARFPQPALLMALLEQLEKNDLAWLRDFLQLTLEQMAEQGLHDVVGGGFFRYTIDPNWQTPHYEKMLYTNAGLVQVYMKAYRVFHQQRYLEIARETMGFMLREMWSPAGFVSSLSAQDERGREGGAYLWQPAEMQSLLTAEQWQKVTGEWRFIQVAEGDGLLPAGLALADDWHGIRQRLLKKRRQTGMPVDDKVLPSWNGYALSALAELYITDKDQAIKKHGELLFKRLQRQLEQGLVRKAGMTEQRFIEDYAFVIQGMLDWAAISGRDFGAEATRQIVRAAQLFAADHGWRLSDLAILPLPADQRNIADGELPSAEIVIRRLIDRLGLGAHPALGKLRRDASREVDARMLHNPTAYASHISYLGRDKADTGSD